MSKKRRTRAQKIRAEQRRQQAPLQPAQSSEQAVVAEREDPKKPAASSTSPTVNQPAAKPKKPSDLKFSLLIFSSLIAVQLALWLVFSLSSVDESIYRLIKL